ncbi:MAG TPA: hypothetical protein PK375_08800 [Rhodocyclaceae bacterium]|nr:hypothetical protein [Rhodocyclaceae bacterium]
MSASAFEALLGRRLVLNVFRVGHLVGVVGTGAGVLDRVPPAHGFVLLLVLSGLAMVVVDRLGNPDYFRQIHGLWTVIKVLSVVALGAAGLLATAAFWIVLAASVIVAHAPARFRHRPWRNIQNE